MVQAAQNGMAAMVAAGRRLSVTTWNIAAINNNPFEYWITTKENPAYEKLMIDIENFLEKPVLVQEQNPGFLSGNCRLHGVFVEIGWVSSFSLITNEVHGVGRMMENRIESRFSKEATFPLISTHRRRISLIIIFTLLNRWSG